MFHIFVKGIDAPKNVIEDVSLAFAELTLSGDPMEERILETIDKAKFCDSMSFYDRNGAKAALVVYHRPNETINLKR